MLCLSKRVLFFFVFVFFNGVTSAQSKEGFSDVEPKTIEVFYDYSAGKVAEIEIVGVELSYYQLDEPVSLQDEISKVLPTNLEDATIFMGQYAASEVGKNKIQKIVDGYQGVGRAYGLGVTKLPAVVVDGRYVVYGTTDVNDVLRIWKNKQGGASE